MSRVVVFALGWACGPAVAEHLLPLFGHADAVWLYDWHDVPSDRQAAALREQVARYDERYLVAWSFGVWAAERIFESTDFTRAIAFNGTPLPCDERFGIGSRRLRLTLKGLSAGGMESFDRRAYGTSYQRLLPALDPRGLQANIAELENLTNKSEEPYTPSLGWDAAVVGSSDVIFPPENMVAWWGERAKVVPLPHYPFEDIALVADIFGFGSR